MLMQESQSEPLKRPVLGQNITYLIEQQLVRRINRAYLIYVGDLIGFSGARGRESTDQSNESNMKTPLEGRLPYFLGTLEAHLKTSLIESSPVEASLVRG